MGKEIGWGWKRNHMGDQPALVGDERADGNKPTIPQQCGFTTPEGTDLQVSYERALQLGLIDESEERWEMSHKDYLEQNGL